MVDTHVSLDIREVFGNPLLVRFQNVWLSYCAKHWNLAVCGSEGSVHILYHIQPCGASCKCTDGGVKLWCWDTNTSKSNRSDSDMPYWLQECLIRMLKIFTGSEKGVGWKSNVLEGSDCMVNRAWQLSIGKKSTSIESIFLSFPRTVNIMMVKLFKYLYPARFL